MPVGMLVGVALGTWAGLGEALAVVVGVGADALTVGVGVGWVLPVSLPANTPTKDRKQATITAKATA